jgi:mannose-1-phosphate guanylyltransferase
MDLEIGDEPAGLGQLIGLLARIPADPDRLLLVGVPATAPETDHGWIEPGAVIAMAAGQPIRSVRRFVDHPSPEVARAIHAKGWLWSAQILIGRAAAFLALGRSYLPWLVGPLETAVLEAGHAPLADALNHAYARLRRSDVARDLLELVPERLGVAVLPALGLGRAS